MPLPNNTSSTSSKSGSLLSRVGVNKLPGGSKGPAPLPLSSPPTGNKMGNGASASSINVDGENIDIIKLKTLVPELKKPNFMKNQNFWKTSVWKFPNFEPKWTSYNLCYILKFIKMLVLGESSTFWPPFRRIPKWPALSKSYGPKNRVCPPRARWLNRMGLLWKSNI